MNEKVMNVKKVKLGIKYERMYMCLYTVLNRFCVSSSDDVSVVEEVGFVLKKSDMRKILESVEFYNEDVVGQGEYMDANILSKENMKNIRKSMKQERMNMKKGVLEEELVKKVRKSKKAKVSSVSQEEISVEQVGTPKMKKTSEKSKKSKKSKNEEVDMERVEIDVGKVVVVVEEVVGGDLDVEGEVIGGDVGRDLVEKGGDVGRDLVEKGMEKVEKGEVVGGDVGRDLVEKGMGKVEEDVKKGGKKRVKKPKKICQMVEDIAVCSN